MRLPFSSGFESILSTDDLMNKLHSACAFTYLKVVISEIIVELEY